MPSPAFATCLPSARSFLTWETSPAGSISGSTASRPSLLATAVVVWRLSHTEHDELQPERVELANGFSCGGFDRVSDGKDSRWLATCGDKHHGLAFFLEFRGRRLKRPRPVILSSRKRSGLPIITEQ